MFKVKHKVTEQVCEFDTEASLDGFFDGIADPHNWELVEEVVGVHVELTGQPIAPSGNAAPISDAVLNRAAKDVAAGTFSLAYAASGISAHYGEKREQVLLLLTTRLAAELKVEPEAVESTLEAQAAERVRAAEQVKSEAESRSGG